MAPYLSASPGCALSLLSSKASPWITTSDFSSRSSAALNELIAENRAAVLARQLLADGGGWHTMVSVKQQQQPVYWSHLQHQATPQLAPPHADGWSRLQGTGGHVTLDLMQMPDSFEIVSGRSKSREEDEESSDIWKSLAGTHVSDGERYRSLFICVDIDTVVERHRTISALASTQLSSDERAIKADVEQHCSTTVSTSTWMQSDIARQLRGCRCKCITMLLDIYIDGPFTIRLSPAGDATITRTSYCMRNQRSRDLAVAIAADDEEDPSLLVLLGVVEEKRHARTARGETSPSLGFVSWDRCPRTGYIGRSLELLRLRITWYPRDRRETANLLGPIYGPISIMGLPG
ncbi:hypothetical protein BHE74_00022708 [Ensete ventricosum]|uniref:Uncharacterized protein n=1 Tax=Ensete ventricosum TaxID=4639 RepID=A0A444GAF8_ENSVE|nr:hypothetical protein GW17_00003486 [Ensete ventricosum]RWW69672.1 hypothetical protein BHE74_00022708 [Ensete ventricosum]RZR71068.1 hypothetical protein BHM03_00003283 [Ensete ventricosum]